MRYFYRPRCSIARQADGRLRAVWARWLWCCCALQLCMALLGQMHQVVHAPHLGAQQLAADAQRTAGDAPANDLDRWFGAHGSNDCELFHHLALGPAMACAATALHTFLCAPVRNACMGALLLRQSPALYFARGPPTV